MNEYFIAKGGRGCTDEILRGDVFYDHIDNVYVIITDAVFTDELRYICIKFDGYKTDHSFIDNAIYTRSELQDEEIFNKVGGIY